MSIIHIFLTPPPLKYLWGGGATNFFRASHEIFSSCQPQQNVWLRACACCQSLLTNDILSNVDYRFSNYNCYKFAYVPKRLQHRISDSCECENGNQLICNSVVFKTFIIKHVCSKLTLSAVSCFTIETCTTIISILKVFVLKFFFLQMC